MPGQCSRRNNPSWSNLDTQTSSYSLDKPMCGVQVSRFIPCRVSDILIAEQYPATVTAQFINVSLRGIITEFAWRDQRARRAAVVFTKLPRLVVTRIRRKSFETTTIQQFNASEKLKWIITLLFFFLIFLIKFRLIIFEKKNYKLYIKIIK